MGLGPADTRTPEEISFLVEKKSCLFLPKVLSLMWPPRYRCPESPAPQGSGPQNIIAFKAQKHFLKIVVPGLGI